MKNRNKYLHFPVTIWSRDCDVPDHRVFDVDYQLVKNCDLCCVYPELCPVEVVRAVFHNMWMDLPGDTVIEDF